MRIELYDTHIFYILCHVFGETACQSSTTNESKSGPSSDMPYAIEQSLYVLYIHYGIVWFCSP